MMLREGDRTRLSVVVPHHGTKTETCNQSRQTGLLCHFLYSFFILTRMRATGLEPATNGLKGHCSTIELRPRYQLFKKNLHFLNNFLFCSTPAKRDWSTTCPDYLKPMALDNCGSSILFMESGLRPFYTPIILHFKGQSDYKSFSYENQY